MRPGRAGQAPGLCEHPACRTDSVAGRKCVEFGAQSCRVRSSRGCVSNARSRCCCRFAPPRPHEAPGGRDRVQKLLAMSPFAVFFGSACSRRNGAGTAIA
jgi:hypothetical protein